MDLNKKCDGACAQESFFFFFPKAAGPGKVCANTAIGSRAVDSGFTEVARTISCHIDMSTQNAIGTRAVCQHHSIPIISMVLAHMYLEPLSFLPHFSH